MKLSEEVEKAIALALSEMTDDDEPAWVRQTYGIVLRTLAETVARGARGEALRDAVLLVCGGCSGGHPHMHCPAEKVWIAHRALIPREEE